jgi:hypothetical protein
METECSVEALVWCNKQEGDNLRKALSGGFWYSGRLSVAYFLTSETSTRLYKR